MFGGGPAGGAPGGGLFGGMPMPTPEQMAQMQAMMGGGGAGGGFGGFGGPPAPPADSRPAHERYADQLAQLQGMGFVLSLFARHRYLICGGRLLMRPCSALCQLLRRAEEPRGAADCRRQRVRSTRRATWLR